MPTRRETVAGIDPQVGVDDGRWPPRPRWITWRPDTAPQRRSWTGARSAAAPGRRRRRPRRSGRYAQRRGRRPKRRGRPGRGSGGRPDGEGRRPRGKLCSIRVERVTTLSPPTPDRRWRRGACASWAAARRVDRNGSWPAGRGWSCGSVTTETLCGEPLGNRRPKCSAGCTPRPRSGGDDRAWEAVGEGDDVGKVNMVGSRVSSTWRSSESYIGGEIGEQIEGLVRALSRNGALLDGDARVRLERVASDREVVDPRTLVSRKRRAHDEPQLDERVEFVDVPTLSASTLSAPMRGGRRGCGRTVRDQLVVVTQGVVSRVAPSSPRGASSNHATISGPTRSLVGSGDPAVVSALSRWARGGERATR